MQCAKLGTVSYGDVPVIKGNVRLMKVLFFSLMYHQGFHILCADAISSHYYARFGLKSNFLLSRRLAKASKEIVYCVTNVWKTTTICANLIYGRGRTGLMVRASDSGSGDPGSILGRVGVCVSLSKRHLLPKSTGNTQE